MRPTHLTISAFGPYVSVQELDLNVLGTSGIYLIAGDTGAGKTTIFDAISYALFGAPSGDVRTETMLRSLYADIETPTEVKLSFVHRGQEYTVIRRPQQERPKKKGKKEGSETTMEKAQLSMRLPDGTILDKNKTEAKLNELLGINREQFSQIAMIAQGKFEKLLLSETKDRQTIFRQIFKTERFEKFQKRVKDKTDEEKRQCGDIMKSIQQYVHDISYTNDSAYLQDVEDVKANNKPIAETLELLSRLIAEEEAADNTLKEQWQQKDKFAKQLNANIATAENQTKARQAKMNAVEQLKTLEPETETLEAGCNSIIEKNNNDIDTLQRNIGQIDQKLPEYDKLEKDRLTAKKLQAEINAQTAKQTNDEKELNKLKEYVKALGNELSSISEAAVNVEKLTGELKAKNTRKKELDELDKDHGALDTLTRELGNAQKGYQEAESKANAARENARTLRTAFNREQAGIMAENLTDGQPCPVCGSTTHPHKAVKAASAPTEAKVKEAEERAEAEQDVANRKSQYASALKGKLETKELTVITKAQKLFEVNTIDTLSAAIRDAQDAVNVELRSINDQLEAEKTRVERKAELEKEIPQMQGRIEKDNNALTQLKTDLTAHQTLFNALQEQIAQQVKSLPFATKEDALQNKNQLQKIITQLQKEIQNATEKLADHKNKIIECKANIEQADKLLTDAVTMDIPAEKDNLDALEQELSALQDKKQKNATAFENNSKLLEKLNEQATKMDETEKRCRWMEALHNTVNGSINGKPRIQLETFFQMTLFDRIILRANVHLMRMSSGKYDLIRRKEKDGNGQMGLDLNVIDHYVGKERSVKSLSGGETFLAALALALGFSEEIQANAGGVVLDTMFVDEGFGTLDENSLKQALDALNSLTENNRLIGIISHVEELRGNIKKQILVTKAGASTACGSQVTIQAQ